MQKKFKLFRLIVIGLAIVPLLMGISAITTDQYEKDLDDGWDEFINGLEDAKDNLTDLTALPPPNNPRNLSNGYRYLMGHLARISASEFNNDPLAPRFQRAVSFFSKWTGDNADAVYLLAPIDGTQQYKISGRVPYYQGDNAVTLHQIPEAPGLVLFAVNTATIGDTGNLKEMADCRNQTLSALDSFQLAIEADGSFEILLAPEKPNGYTGNFLDTQMTMECKDRDGNTLSKDLRTAENVVLREIFFDWQRERPLDLDIVRIGFEGLPPTPVSTAERRQQLINSGQLVAKQIRFWNYLQYIGLELYRDVNFDGKRRLPLNSVNPPSPPSIASGTAGAKQLYAAGRYELEDDEALLLEIDIREKPYYMGFHLSNGWMESLDQANYLSSRNHTQLEYDASGNTYLVISARDPGVANWVDTTGLPEGAMNFRFYYEKDYNKEQLPVITGQKVALSDLADRLPQARPSLPETQVAEVAIRQKHMRQRLREY